MATVDAARQMEAEDLARARELVQMILRAWDLITWDELLGDDVVLSLRVGAVGFNQLGELGGVGGSLDVTGREDAKRVLKVIYGDLRRGLSVTTEIVSGYDAVLLGDLSLRGTSENAEPQSQPMLLYMAFDDDGRVEKMTIAAVDLHPLIEAIRAAVHGGAGGSR